MGCSCSRTNTLPLTNESTDDDMINTTEINKYLINIKNEEKELNFNNLFNGRIEFDNISNKEFPNIEKLVLSNNNLTDISILEKLKTPNLKILDLSHNNIDNLEVFKMLNFPLEKLNLDSNKIKDISLLEEIPIFKNLKELSIKDNEIEYEKNKDILANLQKYYNIKFETNTQYNDRILEEQMEGIEGKVLKTLSLSSKDKN